MEMEKYINNKSCEMAKEKGNLGIYAIAAEKERSGERVIHMEIGRPDFDTPDSIKEATIKSLEEGFVHYTEVAGIEELRKAIVDREKVKSGLEFNHTNEVLITAGASEGLYCIWNTFLNPNDEVLIPSPFYSSYICQLTYSDAKIVKVPIMKEGKISYDIEEFESRLTDKTKMILINSPNNPTGHVMNEEELKMIAQFAIDNDLIVVSDECYDSFVFDGKFKSIASLPGMRERTLIVNSTSKTFSMTGWRIGYIIGNPYFIEHISKIHAHIVLCATSFAQVGAAEAYKNVFEDIDIMLEEFKRRKEFVVARLREIEGIKFVEPQGAFYVFFSLEEFGITGTEFCEEILKSEGIALAPGRSFGTEWDSYVRLAYTCSMEDIEEAMKLIKSFLARIK